MIEMIGRVIEAICPPWRRILLPLLQMMMTTIHCTATINVGGRLLTIHCTDTFNVGGRLLFSWTTLFGCGCGNDWVGGDVLLLLLLMLLLLDVGMIIATPPDLNVVVVDVVDDDVYVDNATIAVEEEGVVVAVNNGLGGIFLLLARLVLPLPLPLQHLSPTPPRLE